MIIENWTKKKNLYIEIMKIKEEKRKMDENSEGSFWKIKWTRTQNTTPTISQWRKSKNEWLMTTKLMTQSKRKIVTISKKAATTTANWTKKNEGEQRDGEIEREKEREEKRKRNIERAAWKSIRNQLEMYFKLKRSDCSGRLCKLIRVQMEMAKE